MSAPGPTQGIHEAIGADLDAFEGILRCGVCARRQVMRPGDAGRYLRAGWPKCCTYTMTWWTQNQVDRGEVPSDV